eukprot:8564178-Ditylum_brightwellii.AAC.1
MEQEYSSPYKPTSPTSKEENDDAPSVSEATTSPPGTPELVRQQRLAEERDQNNNPNYPIIITDKTEYFNESVLTNITDIDARSNKLVRIGDYCFTAKEWKSGQ